MSPGTTELSDKIELNYEIAFQCFCHDHGRKPTKCERVMLYDLAISNSSEVPEIIAEDAN